MNAVPQIPAPRVGIIMGSQSDWPTMQRATEILEELAQLFRDLQVFQAKARRCGQGCAN